MNKISKRIKINSLCKGILYKTAAGLALVGVLLLGSGPAFAQDGGYTGSQAGFNGPGPALVTVEQAKAMSDNDHVTLRGYII